MAHRKTTGKAAARAASKVLRGNFSKTAKRAAGSALSQRTGKKSHGRKRK